MRKNKKYTVLSLFKGSTGFEIISASFILKKNKN